MRIGTSCNSCDSSIYIEEKARNRYELSKKVGENINLTCPKCGEKDNYHLRDVVAENNFLSKLVFPISLIVSVLSIVILWKFGTDIYSFQLIPTVLVMISMIATAINFNDQEKVKYFNAYRVD